MNLSFTTSTFLLLLAVALNHGSVAEASKSVLVADQQKIGAAAATAAVPSTEDRRKLSDDSGDEDSSDEDDEEEEEAQEEEMEMYYAYGAVGSATFLLSAAGLLEWRRRIRVKTAETSDGTIQTNYVATTMEMA